MTPEGFEEDLKQTLATPEKMFIHKYEDKNEGGEVMSFINEEPECASDFDFQKHFIFVNLENDPSKKVSLPFALFEELPVQWGVNIEAFMPRDGTESHADLHSSVEALLNVCASKSTGENICGVYTESLKSFFEKDEYSLVYSDRFKVNQLIHKDRMLSRSKQVKGAESRHLYDDFIIWGSAASECRQVRVPEWVYHPSLLKTSLLLFGSNLMLFSRKSVQAK